MIIKNILLNPKLELQRMERLVNDGSPSNFSFKYTTSKETCPLYVDRYTLCSIKNACKDNTEFIGKIPDYFRTMPYCFLIHPDWKYIKHDFKLENTPIYVAPTASSRTVLLLDSDYYIKLHYPGILGRITRELKREHILSSIDVSCILNSLIDNNSLPKEFAYFPEEGGKLFHSVHEDIGFVIRSSIPIGKNAGRIKALIPAFSLFSIDKTSNDSPLITQLLTLKSNPIDYLLNKLIYPIIDIFFGCVFKGGLLLEMHSQNFLVGIDENYDIVSVILRDLESVDKDLTIIKNNKLQHQINSFPYKCIYSEQYNYTIKHSFMYDHKLGEYFFDQLLDCLENEAIIKKEDVQKKIVSYLHSLDYDLTGFFPKNHWYKFSNVIVDRNQTQRPYVCISNPKYR